MDLETLVCSRDGFGLESATLLQRAICRIVQGKPLEDLLARASETERECVRAAIGCDVSELPGSAPRELHLLMPVRTFKTILTAAISVVANQAADVSQVKPGQEPPRFSALSTQVDTARALRGHLEILKVKPAFRRIYVGDTADGVVTRHPSGLEIETKIVAAQRGGYTIHSRWSTGVAFSEAPGWFSTDRVVSLEENRDTALGRLLPGAQIIYEGSKWQPSGFCYSAFQDHFGKPSADVIVISPSPVGELTPAEQLNPLYWTPERVAQVKRQSPRTYSMHVLNQFGASAAAAYELADVAAAGNPRAGASYIGERILLVDPSKLLGSDAWAAMVVSWRRPAEQFIPRMLLGPGGEQLGPARDEWQRPIIDRIDPRPYLSVDHAVAWRDRPQWDELVERIRAIHDAFGFARGFGDYGGDTRALESAILKMGAQFTAFPMNSAPRRAAYEWLGRLLTDRAIHIPQADVRADLLRVQMRLQPGGEVQYFARRDASGHADLASCLVAYGMAEVSGELWSTPHTLAGPRHIADPR